MMENEAIEELQTAIELAKMCTQNLERKREIQAYEMAIKALEEVQQYRAIGTPEECRAAVEKQTAKKVEIWADGSEHCPCCDKNNSYLGFKVCIECGQLLDWNEET